MGGGKFHWNHGKPRIQRFLTQRARSTQRKAVFGVSERRNQWSRWRGSAWWGHIAEVPHDFAPTGAGQANESDAPAVRPYQFWTAHQRENPVGAHRRGARLLARQRRLARAGRMSRTAAASHPYQLWTTHRHDFPAGTPETTPGTGMLPGRQRIARAFYAFTLKGAPPSFGRFLVSFSRCKRKSVARDRGW